VEIELVRIVFISALQSTNWTHKLIRLQIFQQNSAIYGVCFSLIFTFGCNKLATVGETWLPVRRWLQTTDKSLPQRFIHTLASVEWPRCDESRWILYGLLNKCCWPRTPQWPVIFDLSYFPPRLKHLDLLALWLVYNKTRTPEQCLRSILTQSIALRQQLALKWCVKWIWPLLVFGRGTNSRSWAVFRGLDQLHLICMYFEF
jgi:hypothetical protein